MKKVITGITTTGTITLGNYIGAIKPMLELQDESEMYMFVADLHALVTPGNAKDLRERISNASALYFACGFDSNKTTIFIQSEVPAHPQLAWILGCNTTIGELSRMTQFKDKSQAKKSSNGTETIPTGLLTYPTLMAADILLYDINIVPVGKDQKQHIELTRNIATRMNNKYGKDLFTIPEEYTTTVSAKIMDLQDPTKKMSKSSDNLKSFISLLDSPELAKKKINSAVTDSENLIKYDPENKPGVSNLITIYSSLKNMEIEEVVKHFENQNYGVLKFEVGQVVGELLADIQSKFIKLVGTKELRELLDKGKNRANEIANKKLKFIQEKIGL
ncbi:tryptophanyl-tRNA synthetase [Spiroplasma sp. TIUS-1]|uniref:tryptophan--tRNA ligase n=1 Tax=Spiroplasma sp. TIUS-1 TaxID=216963 RepID=UPI00139878D6|nr:tryptophan--tRNA ligase [Spiroplasma sp. TIUS-1]QHX36052.1 tryptophanyl-tRNA synthetase [Spiroplasma sp. TIUS-1]